MKFRAKTDSVTDGLIAPEVEEFKDNIGMSDINVSK